MTEDIHGSPEGAAPKGVARNPQKWSPEGWGPAGWDAQNFALCFPLPSTIFFLSTFSWGSSRGILVVF